MEGNTLTASETQIVLEKGITIGGKSLAEHLEIVGHRDALHFVTELAAADTPVTERTIREIHSLVMSGQSRTEVGAYRRLNVMAAGSGYRYPDHWRVPELMVDYVRSWADPSGDHPIRLASARHLDFVTIHPFEDGNGRVGRLLLNLSLLRAGYPVATIPVSARARYIRALELAQSSGDRAELDSLVLEAVEASIEEVLEVASTASP